MTTPVESTLGTRTHVPSKTTSNCEEAAGELVAAAMKDLTQIGCSHTGGVVRRPVVGVPVSSIADEGLPRCSEGRRNTQSVGKAAIKRVHQRDSGRGVDLPPCGDH